MSTSADIRGMDIRAQILKEHGRANAQIIADFVGQDVERFAELVRAMLGGERVVAQRAAFSVGIVAERHPVLVKPHLKRMLDALEQPMHNAVHRNIIRILQACELPRALHGRIIQAMFMRMTETAQPIAVRAFAITVAERIVLFNPELGREFELMLEDLLRNDPGPAIRSRASKALWRARKGRGADQDNRW